ncbi:MAG TPA: branched-chain amino acid ABC transporter permease [Candidatus Acidoferrales bacterium]|nr:branched-chain amino acid ABC transporter permease [Candidatus Acidoferrales bacterium]
MQIFINGLIVGLVYALVALGFNIIYRGTKVFHIAHGAIYTSAPYFFLGWVLLTGSTHFTNIGSSLFLGLVSAIVITCLLSALIELIVYRPHFMKGSSSVITFVSSLGVYIVVINLIAIFFGNTIRYLYPGLQPTLTFWGVRVTQMQVIEFIVSIISIIGFFILLEKSSLGRKIRAVSDNSTLANVLGISAKRIRVQVFLVGSLLASIASLLIAFDVGVTPFVGMSAVLTAAVAVIIGGVNSYRGSVVGAILLGLSQNVVIWFLSDQWKDAVTFLILVIVLVCRRQGLLSAKMRLEEK